MYPGTISVEAALKGGVWLKELLKFRRMINNISVTGTNFFSFEKQYHNKLVLTPNLLSVWGIARNHARVSATIIFKEEP